MPRVMIHSRDNTVEVEEDTASIDTVVEKARAMWQEFFGGPATEERQP